MLCVFVSNFSIYVYPNKTFIVTRSLRRLWLPLAFSSCAPCLTLITTKTIIVASTHSLISLVVLFVVVTLDLRWADLAAHPSSRPALAMGVAQTFACDADADAVDCVAAAAAWHG